ncbi:hypothetical protein BDQ17DRAFT_1353263 [Cyathus striatus]|nr:hypothetical protein BDQ17DRAFT_1353263 [Cyathus striatus]
MLPYLTFISLPIFIGFSVSMSSTSIPDVEMLETCIDRLHALVIILTAFATVFTRIVGEMNSPQSSPAVHATAEANGTSSTHSFSMPTSTSSVSLSDAIDSSRSGSFPSSFELYNTCTMKFWALTLTGEVMDPRLLQTLISRLQRQRCLCALPPPHYLRMIPRTRPLKYSWV